MEELVLNKDNLEEYAQGNLSKFNSIVIDSSIDSIPANYFENRLTNSHIVTIGSGVKHIEDFAFNECTGLTSVIFEEGSQLEDIGMGAFYACGLAHISIPDNVSLIGIGAFAWCENMTSVVLPKNLKTVEYEEDYLTLVGPFIECNSIQTVEFRCETIDTWVFNYYDTTDEPKNSPQFDSATTVVFGDTVRNVKYDFSFNENIVKVVCRDIASWCNINWVSSPLQYSKALYLNDELVQNLVIPANVSKLNSKAFQYCESLQTVTISSSLSEIRELAFEGCVNLNRVNVSNIEDWLKIRFYGVEANPLFHAKEGLYINNVKVKEVEIPNTITQIHDFVFYGYEPLEKVTFKDALKITNVGYDSFTGTTWFNNLPNGLFYIGNILFRFIGDSFGTEKLDIEEGTLVIFEGALKNVNAESITIPSSVTVMHEYAIGYCKAKKIVIDCNLSNADKAFEGSDFTEIEFGPNVTTLGKAFYGYEGTSIEIPQTVTSIENEAFHFCSNLQSITIPSWITSIGNHIFKGCHKLGSIEVHEDNPNYYSGGSNSIISRSTQTLLAGCINSTILDSVEKIGDYAFMGLQLTNTIRMKNVKRIGISAFEDCVSTIDDNGYLTLELIDARAFKNSTINSIYISVGDSIWSSIGVEAFMGCKSEGSPHVDAGKMLQSIGNRAFCDSDVIVYFSRAKNLKNIGIEAFKNTKFYNLNCIAEVSIERGAFEGSSLETIYLPNVTRIEERAFSNCSYLTKVIVGLKLKRIEKEAFSECGNLPFIYIPYSVSRIDDEAFYDCGRYTDNKSFIIHFGSHLIIPSFGKNVFRTDVIEKIHIVMPTWSVWQDWEAALGNLWNDDYFSLSHMEDGVKEWYGATVFLFPPTILFNVNDITFIAEDGMTWEDWTESDYSSIYVETKELSSRALSTEIEADYRKDSVNSFGHGVISWPCYNDVKTVVYHNNRNNRVMPEEPIIANNTYSTNYGIHKPLESNKVE